MFACAHTVVVTIWHVLADDEAVFEDLGADWFERRSDSAAHTRRLPRELETFGHRVTFEPAARHRGDRLLVTPPDCRGLSP
jgi:transposase